MIISRTPFRISFFGGGSDYVTYFRENPGASLVTTIDKYLYLTARWLPHFFDFKYRIVYSKVEDVDEIKFIQHPSVRETFKYLGIDKGVEIHPASDLPARTGIGSSSAFTIGLVNAMRTLIKDKKDKLEMAKDAIYIEQTMCKDAVGCQDQLSIATGGLNHIRFGWEDEKPKFTIDKVKISQERIKQLEDRLMLFFTGFSRNASDIAKSVIDNVPNKKKELSIMYTMVEQAIDILHTGELDDFGSLLHDNWHIKRSLSNKVSNNDIDELYSMALTSGAIGGKLLGAGGGGFLLLYVKPEKKDTVRKSLDKLIEVPFHFENTGTEIIVDHEE